MLGLTLQHQRLLGASNVSQAVVQAMCWLQTVALFVNTKCMSIAVLLTLQGCRHGSSSSKR